MKKKLILLFRRLRALLPSKLPVGRDEFLVWADSFSELYELPTKHLDSIRFVLATTIMNLGPQTHAKPKYYFYITMVAGCAKQVAGSVFHEIKVAQKEAERQAQLDAQKAASEVPNGSQLS